MSHDGMDMGGHGVDFDYDSGRGFGGAGTRLPAASNIRLETTLERKERGFELHVISHGAVDLKKVFFDSAEKAGLVTVAQYRGNLVPEDRVERKILDWDAFSPPDDEVIKPAGFYPGCTGWTRLWKDYWQLGVRGSRLAFWEPLRPDFSQRTYLEAASVTWCYKESADLETRFELKVLSLYVWDPRQQVWMYDGPAFDRHMAVADKLARKVFELLKNTLPFPHAARFRAHLLGQSLLNGAAGAGVAPSNDARPATEAADQPATRLSEDTRTGGGPCRPASGADLDQLFAERG